MNILLDTHVLLWALHKPAKLTPEVRESLEDPANHIFVSAVSAWEIAVKAALNKLHVPPDLEVWIPKEMERARLVPLAITILHAVAVAKLPHHHSDPFDRLLIAQARAEKLTLVTADPQIVRYDVKVLWD